MESRWDMGAGDPGPCRAGCIWNGADKAVPKHQPVSSLSAIRLSKKISSKRAVSNGGSFVLLACVGVAASSHQPKARGMRVAWRARQFKKRGLAGQDEALPN